MRVVVILGVIRGGVMQAPMEGVMQAARWQRQLAQMCSLLRLWRLAWFKQQ